MKKLWQLIVLTFVLAVASAPLYADGPSSGNPPPPTSGSGSSSPSGSTTGTSTTTSDTITVLVSLLGYLGL